MSDLLERRRLKIQRNEELLQRLGLWKKEEDMVKKKKKKVKKTVPVPSSTTPTTVRRGMRSKRDIQIYDLLFRSRQRTILETLIPHTPWIHCVGPSGTGKTALVRHICERNSTHAYVNDGDTSTTIVSQLRTTSTSTTTSATKKRKIQASDIQETSTTTTATSTLSLAYQLQDVLGDTRAILILDDCSYDPSLLFLPQMLPNLTIITISKSLLLPTMTSDSMSSLQSTLQPVMVRFEAYTHSQVHEILQLPRLQQLMFGGATSTTTTNSFLSQFLSLYSSTDIAHLTHMVRVLWRAQQHDSLEMAAFFQKYLARATALGPYTSIECLQQPNTTTTHLLAKATRFVILAAYLCQINSSTVDRKLFATDRNQRRNTVTKEEDKSLRQKSFSLERLLSVCVSLIQLNEPIKVEGSAFYNVIGNLLENGILVQAPKKRFSSTTTEEEASAIAKSLKIDMDRFIL